MSTLSETKIHSLASAAGRIISPLTSTNKSNRVMKNTLLSQPKNVDIQLGICSSLSRILGFIRVLYNFFYMLASELR